MRWSVEQLAEYMNKLESNTEKEKADQGPESKLQGKITKWAKDQGFPCLTFRKSRKAQGFLLPGWPDITLIMLKRIIFIELKSAQGYLRKEQKNIALQIVSLGHEWYQVKSYKRFLEIINNEGEK